MENTVVNQDLMVEPDAILGPCSKLCSVCFQQRCPRFSCYLRQSRSGISLHSVFPQAPCCLSFPLEGKSPEGFVDIVTSHFLQDSACKLHNQFVNKRARDVLNKRVVALQPGRCKSEAPASQEQKNPFSFSLDTETYVSRIER